MEKDIFQWNAKYETGLPIVDAQHHKLVKLINHLATLRTIGAKKSGVDFALKELNAYAEYHFATEESLMQTTGISQQHYESHCKIHKSFLTEVNTILADTQGNVTITVNAILRFLVKWLILHILGQDMEMATEIKAITTGQNIKQLPVPLHRSSEVILDALEKLYDSLDASYTVLAVAYDKLQQSSEVQLKEAQRLARIGSWELNLLNNHLTWSDEIYRIFEIDPKQFAASYEAFIAAIHPDDRKRVDTEYSNSVKLHTPYETKHRLLMQDGRIKYIQEWGRTFYDHNGKPLRSIGTVQDVTDRVLAEEALRKSEERFRTIANYTYDWEYWRGANKNFLYVSPSCKRITGYSEAEFMANPELFMNIIYADDLFKVQEHLRNEFHDTEAKIFDFRIWHRDGNLRWISHGCHPVFSELDGRFLGRRASNRDITIRKQLEEKLEIQAQSDYLTGIANRRYFMNRGAEELKRSLRKQNPLSFLMLDIDHFKKINDTHGHHIGDLVLQRVAAIFR
ncbi:hypothetical protein TI05_14900, partial [Achromatium sp. WMS3]